MAFYHGIKTSEAATSVSTPVQAQVGITFAVGTAPVYMATEGKINKPVLAYSYKEAVEALGYSDDFENFTLCEVIKSHFQLYGTAPVVFVNVFDPDKHKTAVESAEHTLVDDVVKLPDTAIAATVVVRNTADGDALVKDKDYALMYDGGKLIIEKLSDGGITGASVYISYDDADISKVTNAEIIGGIDIDTGVKTGMELLNSVFPKYGIVPELIIAPGFSHNAEVAAVMATKAGSINGLFKGKALIDADCTAVRKYTDVYGWKSDNNINDTNAVICWPMVALGGIKYRMSTQLAALMATVDTDNGDVPSESPSNKALKADSTVLADGTEVVLELTEANVLNSKGICTAMNMNGRFVAWGNYTACYPASTDVKDYFIPVNRLFGYVARTVILTFWNKLDTKMTRRLIDTIMDSINIWLSGLKAAEHIYGGRVEFDADENPTTALMAGKLKFRIYLTPASPAQEIEFTLEYDVSYVTSALAA